MLVQGLRHAVRVLTRTPGFTMVAVLTLALGIGATTAIFSVVYGVMLKPLPFEDPDRLVAVYHRGPGMDIPVLNQGPATYFTYRDNQRAFEDIGAWDRGEVSITGRGEPERVEALAVSASTLPQLRVSPILGRSISEDDDRPRSPLRVMITHAYWHRKFGGASDVLGQQLVIDGEPAQIVGVLPASFRFLRLHPEVVLPLRPDRAGTNGVSFGFQALARLKPGVTLADANADIGRMIPLVDSIPGYAALRLEPNVRPLSWNVTGDISRILWILFATVSGVLFIACANVANLLLVRAEARQQEWAVRTALGASRTRIAFDLVLESVLLGVGGGLVGLLLASACLGVLRHLAPTTLPRVDEIGLDPAVLIFTVAISLVSGGLFGLVAMWRLGSTAGVALNEGGTRISDGIVRQRMRNTLAIAQVAMALVLLVVSGLMIRTFIAMRQVEPGFVRPGEVQTFRVAIPDEIIEDDREFARAHEQISTRLAQVPGVASVGLSSHITMDGEDNGNPVWVEHMHVSGGTLPPLRRLKTVAPGFFQTMGNKLVAGRAITWADIHQARRVVVVSEPFAREYWRTPGGALGKRLRFDNPGVWYEIVGVSGAERDDGLNRPATAIVYWPVLNDAYMPRTLAYAVRSTRAGTADFLRELQRAVWSVNSNLPLAAIQTLDEIEAASMAATSFTLVMLAIAAAMALLLGIVGIYGVISYSVARRTREIGIRAALGAHQGELKRMFVAHALVLVTIGVAVGVVGAAAATRLMAAMLFGVAPLDAPTYVAVALVLAAAAAVAGYVPARRAAHVDPLVALRYE